MPDAKEQLKKSRVEPSLSSRGSAKDKELKK